MCSSDLLGGIIQNMRMIKTAIEKEGLSVDLRAEGKSVLNYLQSSSLVFDLVFIDPPYDVANPSITQVLTELVPRLAKDATVILERSSRDEKPELPEQLSISEEKNYGDTVVYWLAN